MDIDRTRPIPLYFQVKTLILERISSGAYLPGDRLPTEHEICAQYSISRTPVHRAFSELADEGIIIRRRRHGSVVNPHWAPDTASQASLRVLLASHDWASYVRKAAPDDLELNTVAVGYPNLHRHITRSVAEGQAPDLMLIDSVWVREFAEGGILAPLDDLAPAWIAAEFHDFVPRYEHNGRAIAVAAEVNVAGLWYCKRTFERLGLSLPETWEQLESVAASLKSAQPDALSLAMPLGIKAAETTTYCLVAMLTAGGAAVTTDTAVVLDSVAAVTTLEYLKRLVERGLVPMESVAYDWDRAPELLALGQASMSIGGTYEAPFIAETAGVGLDELDEHFGFAALPVVKTGRDGTVFGGMAYAIPRQSQRPFDAIRLLRALVEPSAAADLALTTGTLPGRRSAVSELVQQMPVLQAAAALIDVAELRPQTVAYNRVSTQLQLMIEAVVLGRTAPSEAVVRTADLIGAITGLPVIHLDDEAE